MAGTWEARTLGVTVSTPPVVITVTLRPGLVLHLGVQPWGQLHFKMVLPT
jgi:hypothetical protein